MILVFKDKHGTEIATPDWTAQTYEIQGRRCTTILYKEGYNLGDGLIYEGVILDLDMPTLIAEIRGTVHNVCDLSHYEVVNDVQ